MKLGSTQRLVLENVAARRAPYTGHKTYAEWTRRMDAANQLVKRGWLTRLPPGHPEIAGSTSEEIAASMYRLTQAGRSALGSAAPDAPRHGARKKSAAQLDREIAQVLSRRPLSHSTQRPDWWLKAAPEEDRVCYDTKTKALKAFLDTNYEVVQNYGGADYAVSPSEFDSVNHKYNLRGNRAAKTISQAVWAAMPEGKPYCLDQIDLDALNDTSPAREAAPFRLPDFVYEAAMAQEEERYYRGQMHARICRRCGRPLR
jgi:hypothetical protein